MRVLIISNSEWRDSNSFGSTFSNFFSELREEMVIANIYCREGVPATAMCHSFLKIADKDLLKGLLHRGYDPAVVMHNQADEQAQKDSSVAGFARKKRWSIFYLAREVLWGISNYKRENFTRFVEDFQPDVIFLPTYSFGYINKMALYLQKKYSLPIISYMSDDEYSLRRRSLSPLFWINRLYQRKWVIRGLRSSQKVFVISTVQQKELQLDLGISSEVLTKSLNFNGSIPAAKPKDSQVRFVYTGNLGDGRWNSIAKLGCILDEINTKQNKHQYVLDIYSGTALTAQMREAFEKAASLSFRGFIRANELPAVWENADYLIHAESLDKKDCYVTHQSFSTKLVDYMHTGRCIVAVGNRTLASIQHLIENHCALVLTDFSDAQTQLAQLFDDETQEKAYICNAWICGQKCHNTSVMADRLRKAFYEVVDSEGIAN